MKISIEANINVAANIAKVDNDKFWTFAANEWWRLITPYTPMQTGTLFESVDIIPKTITYRVPYSHRVYNGKNMHFHTDKHTLAAAEWDKAAQPQQTDKLIRACQTYINRNIKF